MQTSDQINELAAALAKAQSKITGALKDSANPFFKSKYADLASCWDAARDHLTSNGLSVIQTASATDGAVCITTMLAHSSGQWVRDTLALQPVKSDPQGIGSCITYGRRYGFAAIAGIAQVDDDGNAASGKDNRDDSGKPEGWKMQDTRKVTEYKNRIISAAADDKDVREIWDEIKDNHEFATAVWTTLPSPIKTLIKDKAKAA